MKQTNRRVFMLHVVAGSSALAASSVMAQAAAPMVNEKDPQAVGLAYAADTTKVDAKKYPKHTADQKCSNCQLFAGKPKEAAGPCPLFAGKQVAANGWCSAYVKKAA
ncbi:MAG: high-potential iron-sulfur protein [Polaromonas sp.]|nr:high-potential iron-sulfur protein [Polaromonas sp.]